ncbi:hypothetical protein [Terrabacter sp. Ter38]|uniref:hypothetical protein n=1 Tax=Terrabacter sp. Ter38 TaxID=2926030 RepID=UPI002118905C|nr:hypothetical protein [Terrabacter sp. Ter38]
MNANVVGLGCALLLMAGLGGCSASAMAGTARAGVTTQAHSTDAEPVSAIDASIPASPAGDRANNGQVKDPSEVTASEASAAMASQSVQRVLIGLLWNDLSNDKRTDACQVWKASPDRAVERFAIHDKALLERDVLVAFFTAHCA